MAYTAFAIYGSWVPLRFQPVPFGEAWARFQQIQWLNLGIGRRADWVANILLFVPLAFFWLGTLWPRSLTWRLLTSCVVWLLAATLAVCIEFSQVFFPIRTVSLNDIVAECLGAAAGVVVWWVVGPALATWVAELRRVARPMGAIDRILIAYGVTVILYALLPLDLTLSVTEVYHKWKGGGLILQPFAFRGARVADSMYSYLSEVMLWVPLGALSALRWPSLLSRSAARVALVALLLEFLQVFIHTRTTDVNDVLAAALGGLAGAWIAQRTGLASPGTPSRIAVPTGMVQVAALLLAWVAGAALVFWFPFNFNFDPGLIRGRLSGFRFVPFSSYYWGSEYNAVTQVLRKMLYFMPLGALLAWGGAQLRSGVARTGYGLFSALFVVGAAAGIEAGQLALPGKVVDPTDAILATVGAAIGWWLVVWVVRLGRAR